jgi:hypothetical protein
MITKGLKFYFNDKNIGIRRKINTRIDRFGFFFGPLTSIKLWMTFLPLFYI